MKPKKKRLVFKHYGIKITTIKNVRQKIGIKTNEKIFHLRNETTYNSSKIICLRQKLNVHNKK